MHPSAAAAATQADAAHSASFRRWAVLIAAGIFATNLGQPYVLDLPLRNVLKDSLGATRADMAAFWAVATIPWCVKPLAGLLSDAVPFLGTRRRHYLMVGAALAAAFWLLLPFAGHAYHSLLAGVLFLNTALMMASTVVGGLIVDGEKALGAAGRLVAVRVFTDSACLLVAGPIGGLLALQALGITGVAGAVITFSIVPVALLLLREPAATASQRPALAEAAAALRVLLRSRPVWSAAAFIFLVTIPQDFPTVAFYFARDEMIFTPDVIGWLRSVAGVGAIAAAVAYGLIAPKVRLRVLVLSSVVAVAATLAMYTLYSSLAAAIPIEFARGAALTLSFLAIAEMAVWATPAGTSAAGFSVFMSASNLGLATGDVVSSTLADQAGLHVSSLGLVNAAALILMLGFVLLLPNSIFASRDASAGRSDVSPALR